MDAGALKLALIPLIAGAIGYVTNYLAVKMLFWPLAFVGVRVPPLRHLAGSLPRRLQAVPGIGRGDLGWQGIIPSRAAKMGSIAVDKGIAKLGSPSEFYRHLDPEAIAQHILSTAHGEIRELVERIMEREHPQLWGELPPRLREELHRRVRSMLPAIVREITEDVGSNIESLMDVKLMVIRQIETNPMLANRIFLEVGERELRFIVNSGFAFGFLLGLPQVPIFAALDAWFVLPLGGIAVGYLTNWLALKVIFRPVEPRRLGPWRVQGLFLRRRAEVAEVYSKVIAGDVLTLDNIGRELLGGPQSDRTRRLIERRLRPLVDRTLGRARPAVRAALGPRDYETIRDSVATEAVDRTMSPLADAELNRRQGIALRELLEARMHELPAPEFSELLRSAVEEDEWMLILLGAVLGFCAGLLQVAFLF